MRRYGLLIALLIVPLLPGALAVRADEPTYAPWQGPAQSTDMQQLLKQLRALIAKAEQAKAADPVFLSDLKKLADSYDSPWPTKVLYDDFKDGDFTVNPAWTVEAGTWRVDTQGSFPGLRTKVFAPQTTGTSQGGSSAQATALGILGALLNPQQTTQSQQPAQEQYAAISTRAAIPNSFYIRLEIVSRQPGGRFDFGPYWGGQDGSGYYLTYATTAASGLTLSSVAGGSGVKQIARSSGAVHLEDGAAHVIDWKRDRSGKMTVALDGTVMVETTDLTIRKPFEGFIMANSGGSYIIRSVAINGGR